MALTPSGKVRTMVAQQYFNPLSAGHGNNMFSTEDVMEEDIGNEDTLEESSLGDSSIRDNFENDTEENSYSQDGSIDSKEIASSEKKNTLTNYVFEKLRSYGYPGRRLQEFKPKFVKEKVTAEGIKDVQIEVPDKKYPGENGIADTIENEDLKEIVKEIAQQFELNFNGAERSDGKWVIKFTSQKLTDESSEGIVRDNLDEVYGTPSKIKKNKDKIAFTLQEMVNQSKNSLVENLKNIKGN